MSGGQQRFLSEPEAVLVRPGAEARLACVIENMGLTSQCRSGVICHMGADNSLVFQVAEGCQASGAVQWQVCDGRGQSGDGGLQPPGDGG